MNYEIEFKISGLTEEKYNEVMDLMKGMPNAKIKKPVTDSEYVPEFAQSTQEGGTEYGSKMVKAVEKFLKEEPEEAKRLWDEVEAMRLGEPEEEGGTVKATERLEVNDNEFIGQAITMLKEQYKGEWLVAYAAWTAWYAKESNEYAPQVSATDKKRIEELEKENEILKMENSHSKLVVDEAAREIDRLKWLINRTWRDDLVLEFSANVVLGHTDGKLLGEYMKKFKANNNL